MALKFSWTLELLGNLSKNIDAWVSPLEIQVSLVQGVVWAWGFSKASRDFLKLPHAAKCEDQFSKYFV